MFPSMVALLILYLGIDAPHDKWDSMMCNASQLTSQPGTLLPGFDLICYNIRLLLAMCLYRVMSAL
jgi:hypothetical protein